MKNKQLEAYNKAKQEQTRDGSSAYKDVFNKNNKGGKYVLDDLQAFCGADTSSANTENVNETFLRLGRREVWLRIQAFLSITENDIANAFKNKQ